MRLPKSTLSFPGCLHRCFIGQAVLSFGAILLLGLLEDSPVFAAELTVKSTQVEGKFQNGSLIELTDTQGHHLVEPGLSADAACIYIGGKKFTAKNATTTEQQIMSTDFAGLPDADVVLNVKPDVESGDLIVTQSAQAPAGHLESAEWTIGYIPLDYNVIIPGGGGEIMTKDSPYKSRSFGYLMGWDAQLLVFEGKGHGFYLWCDDPDEKQKAISINRTDKGWVVTCRSTNDAPFDALTSLQSRNWRINTYTGDWRVPARRYREWAQKTWDVKPLVERSPAWVKDIRTFVFMEQLEPALLDEVAHQLDPAQTVIYLSAWRKQQFDRDNPSYGDPNSNLKPMMDKAHQLGFKVILHTNFWGVSPENPLMAGLAKYQVTGLDGKKLRYENLKQNPPLFLNYISPASKEWREAYIAQIKNMIQITGADGVHLDQDFHSHNDLNGLIDGKTFNEGLLALHAELKAALPEVAISGEGLNEMTYRTVDFAQRHVWSAMAGTIDHAALSVGHPISSYLFSPYLRLYGWLGFPTPQENPQMYAAWREDYKDWGIYPTLRYFREVSPEGLRDARGFYRQLLDEAQFFQKNQVEPDLDRTWDATTGFAFKTAKGEPVLWTKDRRLVCGDHEISRTITGVSEVELPGSIDQTLFFDNQRIFGLNPDLFYPYFTRPCDAAQVHVEHLTTGLRAEAARKTDDFLLISTSQAEIPVQDLVEDLPQALCGIRLDSGQVEHEQGGVTNKSGAQLNGAGTTLALTPPSAKTLAADLESTAVVQAKGLGDVTATYQMTVPEKGATWFRSFVGMDGRAVRTTKTDGMKFTVTATCEGKAVNASAAALDDTQIPLNLDLTLFAGKKIELELAGGPGPAHDATEDRGIWYRPHLVQLAPIGTDATRIAHTPADWNQVADETGSVEHSRDQDVVVIPPHAAGRMVIGRLPFQKVMEGAKLATLKTTLSPTDLWNWLMPQGLPLPTLQVQGDDLSALLPVRSKLTVDWLLSLPESLLFFQAAISGSSVNPGRGIPHVQLAVNDKIVADVAMPPKGTTMLQANLKEWAGHNVVVSLILQGKDFRGDTQLKIGQPELIGAIPPKTLLHWNFEALTAGQPISEAKALPDAATPAPLEAQESPPTLDESSPKSTKEDLTKSANFAAASKQFMRSKGLGKALVIPMRSGFTVEAWVNLAIEGKDGIAYIISNRDPGRTATGYSLVMKRKGATATPGFVVTSGGDTATANSTTPLKAGEWHHLAGIRTDDGHLTLYVDGVQAADSGQKLQPGVLDSYVNLTVGRSPHTGAAESYFNGQISEIQVTSGALPPTQFRIVSGSLPSGNNPVSSHN